MTLRLLELRCSELQVAERTVQPDVVVAPAPVGDLAPGIVQILEQGQLKGHYAVSVSGNWRVTFRFEDGAAVDVDYLDYH